MSSRREQVQALQRRLVTFGIAVCRSLRGLPRDPITMHFVSQIARSSSAPSAIYAEARSAESQRDFIHKMQLGLKELRETTIWLEYLNELSRTTPERKLPSECGELIGIFVSSIKTARGRKSI